MKDRNISAYTAPGADFPEYLSINRCGGEIVVTVRTKDGAVPPAEMTLPADQLDELIGALRRARPILLVGR